MYEADKSHKMYEDMPDDEIIKSRDEEMSEVPEVKEMPVKKVSKKRKPKMTPSEWLRDTLSGEEVRAEDVLKKAEKKGYNTRQMMDACKEIGVVQRKIEGYGGEWMWKMP